MFRKTLNSILAKFDQQVAELELFLERNNVVVKELRAAYEEAEADQRRAKRVSDKLKDLLS